MRLSSRLEAVIAACGRGNMAADIGCDHGFVAIELVERGLFRRAAAMDLREGPLSRAESHIRERGLADRIEVRLSDGLERLEPGEADTIVIAGMGGPLMEEILRAGEQTAKQAGRLVLSPQSDIPSFRKYLIENGYRIPEEEMLREDGKTYVVLTAVPGQEEAWEEEEYRWGRSLIRRRHPVLREMLEQEIARDRILADRLKESAEGQRGNERLREIMREMQMAEKILAAVNERKGEKTENG